MMDSQASNEKEQKKNEHRECSDSVVDETEHYIDDLLARLNNVPSAPGDGRLILSGGRRSLAYMEWLTSFYSTLHDNGGSFWIRDYGQDGTFNHYHYNHNECEDLVQDREHRTLEWLLRNAQWPHREQKLGSREPLKWLTSKDINGRLVAPWKRLMSVSIVLRLDFS